MPRTITARLTLLFFAGTLVTLAVALSLLYAALDTQLTAAVDEGLQDRAEGLVAGVAADDLTVLRQEPNVELYTDDGAVVATSMPAGHRLLSPAAVPTVREGITDRVVLASGQAGDDVRVLVRRLVVDGRSLVLAVGARDEPAERARNRLLVVLLGAAPILALLLTLAARGVIRAALRPVDQLTREAAEISRADPNGQLPVIRGDDEIARLSRTLNGMLARLHATFAHERAFVDDASHELRTPLAVLSGELELAISGLPADPTAPVDRHELEESLRRARAETERLIRLADDLLVLAREAARPPDEVWEPVDLGELVERCIDRLSSVLDVAVAPVAVEHVDVTGSERGLERLLTNLLVNAGHAGATRVEVSVGRRPDGAVLLTVADDGPGFPEALLPVVFDRFTSGSAARTRSVDQPSRGAGLGLAIAAAIAESHGATISAENGPPLGGAVLRVVFSKAA